MEASREDEKEFLLLPLHQAPASEHPVVPLIPLITLLFELLQDGLDQALRQPVLEMQEDVAVCIRTDQCRLRENDLSEQIDTPEIKGLHFTGLIDDEDFVVAGNADGRWFSCL